MTARFGIESTRFNMYNTSMRSPKVEFIGWEKSALELVGEKLLALMRDEPDTFRRATIVVPTAESGRRLKEWMAVQAGKPLLMPRMALAGQLIPARGENIATDLETLAAWVEVLTEKLNGSEDAWDDTLFALPQQKENWALGTAQRLMQLQRQLVQYDVDLQEVEQIIRKSGGLLCETAETRESLSGRERESWLGVADAEMTRWQHLQGLFASVDARLKSMGKLPLHEAEEAEIRHPRRRHENAVIIVACLPEISPQVQRYLKKLETERAGSVRIWVNVQPGQAGIDIDRCGCIDHEYWLKHEFGKEMLPESSITMSSTAQRMAQAAVRDACGYEPDAVVLGACDAEFLPALVTEFSKQAVVGTREKGWRIHIPEGRSFMGADAAGVVERLAAVCMGRDQVAEWEPLLRNEAMQLSYGEAGFDGHGFCVLLDRLMRSHFPSQMSYLEKLLNPEYPLPGLSKSQGQLPGTPQDDEAGAPPEMVKIDRMRTWSIFRYVQKVRSAVEACRADMGSGLRQVAAALKAAYSGRPLLQQAVEKMTEQMAEVAAFVRSHRAMPESIVWALLRHLVREKGRKLLETDREDTHLDALGWRELPFARGKRIILTGFHDGCVPEEPATDSFLPDSLRKALGMPCRDTREARDSFLLTTLLMRDECDVRIHMSRLSADGSGTPLSPSSLLFRCGGEQLVTRVKNLFRELDAEDELDSYAAWKLKSLKPLRAEQPPPDAEAGADEMEPIEEMEPVKLIAPHWENKKYADIEHGFSPSEIKRFLSCPLRFWMEQALHISPWEVCKADKVEMEANEYGTLLHCVLEDVARRYPKWQDVSAEADVRDYAEARLNARMTERYGEKLLPPMTLQKIKMQQSLKQFVSWHCHELQAGWECFDCEHKVDDWYLDLPDGTRARISMRADRIDRNGKTGAWRVIDYKTHDKPPKWEHLERLDSVACIQYQKLMPDFPLVELPAPQKTRADAEQPEGLDIPQEATDVKNARMDTYRWSNVQLPLYAAWLAETMQPEQTPEMGFLLLPRKADKKVSYKPFVEMDAMLNSMWSALETARQAIMLMRAGLCLYSAETLGCHVYTQYSTTEGLDDLRDLFENLRIIPQYAFYEVPDNE